MSREEKLAEEMAKVQKEDELWVSILHTDLTFTRPTRQVGEGPGEVPQYGDTNGVNLEHVRIQFTYRISKFLLTKWMVWG